ncbi:hypothetical protein ARMSODRAFT_982024 [Armillaria solidipes]|uniref:Uncharacterized protein n=1 Tax=Armillaria solidipes TaxID=1076256 RepID=A0A2H3BAC6_9AGAR|nr:hypothetical protein ARMSODRAFT_982024 [Armillaria solidipes]
MHPVRQKESVLPSIQPVVLYNVKPCWELHVQDANVSQDKMAFKTMIPWKELQEMASVSGTATMNTKFPWKLLKAKTLRSICQDLEIGNVATTKDVMVHRLEQIQDFGHTIFCFTNLKRSPWKSKGTSARRTAKANITGPHFKPKKVIVELPGLSNVNCQEFRTMVTHDSSQDQRSHVSPPLPESKGSENQEENTTSQSTPKENDAVQAEEAIKLEEITHTSPHKQNY